MPIEESPHAKPSGFLTFVWALFFFFVFALVVYIWVQQTGRNHEVEDKRAAARVEKRVALEKADAEKLQTAGWVDQAKGMVRIPVADARRLIAAELAVKKPGASQVKVEPSLPMPAPYNPNAAEPAAPALPSAPQGADTINFGAISAATAPATDAPATTDTKK